MGYQFSAWQALAAMQIAHDGEAEVQKERVSYKGRQMMLKGEAAGLATTSLIPGVDVVTTPASLVLTTIAITDTLIHTHRLDWSDIAVTALGSAGALGKLAKAATDVDEVGEAVETGQKFLHAGAATLAAGSAAVNLRSGSSEQAEANTTAAVKGYDSVKVNANGTVSGKYTTLGSRIPTTTTCDSQGSCTSN